MGGVKRGVVLVVVGFLMILTCMIGIAVTSTSDVDDAPSRGATPASGGSVQPTANFDISERVKASIEADHGIPPKPDVATTSLYIADLNAINPEIVGRHDRDIMVSRGRNQCSTIHDFPNDHVKLVESANYRFTSPNHPDGFGSAIAERILIVVHKRLCPSFPMG
jgi:hypothetical protein